MWFVFISWRVDTLKLWKGKLEKTQTKFMFMELHIYYFHNKYNEFWFPNQSKLIRH
jgi:hypothetical protein